MMSAELLLAAISCDDADGDTLTGGGDEGAESGYSQCILQ